MESQSLFTLILEMFSETSPHF